MGDPDRLLTGIALLLENGGSAEIPALVVFFPDLPTP